MSDGIDWGDLTKVDYQGAVKQVGDVAMAMNQLRQKAASESRQQDIQQQQVNQQGEYYQGLLGVQKQEANTSQQRVAQEGEYNQGQLANTTESNRLTGVRDENTRINEFGRLNLDGTRDLGNLALAKMASERAGEVHQFDMKDRKFQEQMRNDMQEAQYGGLEGLQKFYIKYGMADKAQAISMTNNEIQKGVLDNKSKIIDIEDAETKHKANQISAGLHNTLPSLVADPNPEHQKKGIVQAAEDLRAMTNGKTDFVDIANSNPMEALTAMAHWDNATMRYFSEGTKNANTATSQDFITNLSSFAPDNAAGSTLRDIQRRQELETAAAKPNEWQVMQRQLDIAVKDKDYEGAAAIKQQMNRIGNPNQYEQVTKFNTEVAASELKSEEKPYNDTQLYGDEMAKFARLSEASDKNGGVLPGRGQGIPDAAYQILDKYGYTKDKTTALDVADSVMEQAVQDRMIGAGREAKDEWKEASQNLKNSPVDARKAIGSLAHASQIISAAKRSFKKQYVQIHGNDANADVAWLRGADTNSTLDFSDTSNIKVSPYILNRDYTKYLNDTGEKPLGEGISDEELLKQAAALGRKYVKK